MICPNINNIFVFFGKQKQVMSAFYCSCQANCHEASRLWVQQKYFSLIFRQSEDANNTIYLFI
jgi:hypothetical protein